MRSKKGNAVIREAFKACQDSFSVHPRLVRKLKAFYLSNDPDRFFEDFIWYLQFPISGVTERSLYVDRTLEFVAKFTCCFLEKEEKPTEEIADDASVICDSMHDQGDELPLFMYRLFVWLLDHHEVEGPDARLRVCQLLNKLLKYMGEDACIDDDLYNRIYDGMLERLKDKVAEIRSQAVTALQRLQDPRDEECPIIRAYLFHLAHDPNNVVRRTIVRCIGATRQTLPHVLDRTRDTDELVRRATYKFLSEKVHIKSLTIGQREQVLTRGLGERSETVRKVVEKELIPAWLRQSNNDIVQLLHHLDVGNADQDTKMGNKSAPAGALGVLFMETPYKELVNSFQYLNSNKLIPFENLSAESAMYWRVLAEYLNEQENVGAEEYLESILPELTPFCQYVRKYILEFDKNDEDTNWEFVANELIRLATIYDLGDEVGRQNLCKLVMELISSNKTPVSFIPNLVLVYTKIEKNAQTRIECVAEIISELNNPLDTGLSNIPSSPKEKAVQQAMPDEEAIRAKQLQIAKLRVDMNILRDQLDEAVNDQNFMIAQDIKLRMDQLEEDQVVLEEQLVALKMVDNASDDTKDMTGETEDAQFDLSDHYQDPNSDDNPTVTLKCLRLLVATLQDPSITQLNNTLHTLLEEFVTVSVQSEVPTIRKEAITALACCCLRSIGNARQHMLLLLQAAHIDVHEVRIAAIIAVVDLLMKHGLSSFITQEGHDKNNDTDPEETPCTPTEIDESNKNIDLAMDSELATRGATLTQSELNTQGGNSVVAILTKILDEPEIDLRTEVAEGLCKLLMIGAINSPKLLSRLLLIWYSPMTESDSRLRHILGTFFPLYSSMSKAHQLALEAAFIPTMKVLFDAPITSPLSEIDTEDVGMFFVHLTREDMLQSYDPEKKSAFIESSTTSVHDNMAMAVCNEILSTPNSYQTKSLIKVLTNLALTHNNFVHLKELKVLSELMIQNVKERSCVRLLEKFSKQLLYWLGKDPDNSSASPGSNKRRSTDSDQEDIDIIPESSVDDTINTKKDNDKVSLKHQSNQDQEIREVNIEVSKKSSSNRPVLLTENTDELEGPNDTDETIKQSNFDDVPQDELEKDTKEKSTETPCNTVPTEVILASDKNKSNEDDIFSNTSLVNISKLPKMNDSSDESEEDHTLVQPIGPKIETEQKGKLEGEKNHEYERTIRSTTSSPVPPSTTSCRSSRSSIVSSKCSSRASSVCEEIPTTPPTVKKRVLTTRIKKGGQTKNSKTTVADKETTTPTASRSRSGRQNKPRFNYRTGASIVEGNDSKENIQEKKNQKERKSNTNSRKRSKITESSRSGTSSPQLKKLAGTKVLAANKDELTDSSDFEVIDDLTPEANLVESLTDSSNSDFEIVSQPASPKRELSSRTSSSSRTSTRSTRAARKKV